MTPAGTDMPLLDHLVVVADDLDRGRAWAEARLGQAPGGGGTHVAMGTHNLLWSLGDCYLEVISADPGATSPPSAAPRWFGLDDPATRARLEGEGPFLATWAVATVDLEGFADRAPVSMRPVLPMARGDLAWEVALSAGAAPPLGGLWPLGLRWPPGRHPIRVLPDGGLRLERIALSGRGCAAVAAALPPGLPPDRPEIGPDDGPPRVTATIRRPSGERAQF